MLNPINIFLFIIINSFIFCEAVFLAKSNCKEEIVSHNFYTISYNEDHEQANWVAYNLQSKNLIKLVSRTNNFRIDPLISTGSAVLADYKKSGYDRGHLAPAGDFVWSKKAMSETFYMSNMSPQIPGFNRGIWKKLESLIRDWGTLYGDIHIITGPVLVDSLAHIGLNEVSIPKLYYKVILDFNGNDKKAIGFILENKKSSIPLHKHVYTVNYIEKVTGIDFFEKLDDVEEEALESNFHLSQWEFGNK
jgi:endonuclease G, mitochondrial